MSKNQESIKKALRAGFTLKDIEAISQRADKSMKGLKKMIASCVKNAITKWENDEKADYPLKELDEIHSEFCAQSIGITFKSYDECEKLSEEKKGAKNENL